MVRPLFSLFYPDLTQILQPLSGEYAGYREIFEKIPFPIGYGVETGMLIDIHEKWGLDVMAQVDLDRRVHKNQDTKALGRMAFVIMRTFLNRIAYQERIHIGQELYNKMIQYRLVQSDFQQDIYDLEQAERPPMKEIPEYRQKFVING